MAVYDAVYRTGRVNLESKIQIFRRSLTSQWAIPLSLMAIATTILAQTWLGGEQSWSRYSLVLILFGLAMTTWSLRHYSCIAISADGVMVRRIGYTLFSSWDNVLEIEYRVPAAIELKATPLDSENPNSLKRQLIAWRYRYSYPGCQAMLANGTLIPLDPFTSQIKSGELHSAIRHHWPRLSDSVRKVPKVSQQTSFAAREEIA